MTLQDATDIFYDQKWREWNDMIIYSPAPRYRRKRILSWLTSKTFQSVLDVGCGNAELLAEIRTLFPHVKLVGIDISPEVIAQNQVRLPSASFYAKDMSDRPLDEQFDIVICSEVIEHCPNPSQLIENLSKMTRDSLFITVPCGPIFTIDKQVGHVQHFKATTMNALLSANSLQAERIEEWGFPFFNIYKYLINLAPNTITSQFLSEKRYSCSQKLLSKILYYCFHCCVPFWGYQLFAVASRTDLRPTSKGVSS